MFIGDDLVKRDMAIEIMADMMGKRATQKRTEKDPAIVEQIEAELKVLRKERDAMYSGDKEVINKILTVYAEEIKEYYSSNR